MKIVLQPWIMKHKVARNIKITPQNLSFKKEHENDSKAYSKNNWITTVFSLTLWRDLEP